MLKSLTIQNFKRFRELTFPTLKRVNLIMGKNNTGKTAVLESLILLIEPENFPGLIPKTFRNYPDNYNLGENQWNWLFFNQETGHPIVVITKTDELPVYSTAFTRGRIVPQGWQCAYSDSYMNIAYLSRTVEKVFDVTGSFSHEIPKRMTCGAMTLSLRPTDPHRDAMDYERVVLKSGSEERLEALVRKLEPRLKSIRTIKLYGQPLLYLDIGLPERIPAIHLGQGFNRLLSIYSELIASGKKVLLIDEIENGLHYSVLTEIWRGILNVTEQEGIQVFATTHSYECIRAAHDAFSETLDYDFALHRLEEVKGEVKVITYDKETLEASLANNFEIR
ncbi:MAG: phosphatase [Pedosphaera sp.]|nr:phosphatase [Pedosphaera sp.]